MIKGFSCILLIGLHCFGLAAQDNVAVSKIIDIKLLENSEMSVWVETNVNDFTCTFTHPEQFETMRFSGEIKPGEIYFKDAILNLPVSGFDCGKEVINEDFSALLKETTYPYITIEFKTAKWYDQATREANKKAGKEIGNFEILLSVAGTYHTKEVGIYTTELLDRTLSCTGKVKVNIREFGLEPPEKFFGMVKVKENIEIRFDLNMEKIL